jgi:hypothetical protein
MTTLGSLNGALRCRSSSTSATGTTESDAAQTPAQAGQYA